jgi:hypothetical protein
MLPLPAGGHLGSIILAAPGRADRESGYRLV